LNDGSESVAGASFQRVSQRINQLSTQNDYYSRWSRWMLHDRLQRPVKPFQP
jgi:hypothetical protein